jgi:anion-transporting  ArsA/GET3 family ATPase
MRVFSAAMGGALGVLNKLLGSQVLLDIQTLVGALDTVFGGFRERAERTYRLLGRPSTAFVVVATPDRDALREASYFAGRLSEQRMPLVGLVLNRVVQPVAHLPLDRARVARERLLANPADPAGSSGAATELAAALLALHAEAATAAAVGTRLADRFTAAHPGLLSVPVPSLATDVHDLDALREVGSYLAANR